MTFEARLIFVLLFFALWGFLGFLPWSFAAVIRRGRHVLPALPVALATASLAGVLVPLLGPRDVGGFLLSLLTAFLGGAIGTAAGVAMAVRLSDQSAPSSTDEQDGYTDDTVHRIR
jgi:hypothetical protein